MKRIIVGLLLLSITHCLAFGQKKYKRPKVETPTSFAATPRNPRNSRLGDAKWFEVFRDEKLQGLIRAALMNNYDLNEAVARVDAARANVGIVKSDQYPQFSASTDLRTERLSRSGAVNLPEPIQRDRTFGSVLLNLFTFELDILGRLRKATAAARADLLATEEARKVVMLTLVSDVATAYFTLRELDFELEISRQTLVSRQESLRIIR